MKAQLTIVEKSPLVYSCSGCSGAAQMANYLALQINRSGIGEMSCIAGVGGNVISLVKTARSGRKIVAIDGCHLACCKACLQNHNIQPDVHIELADYGVKKKVNEDFDRQEADKILAGLHPQIERLTTMYVAPER